MRRCREYVVGSWTSLRVRQAHTHWTWLVRGSVCAFTKPHAHGHFCCSWISGLHDARSWLGAHRARPWAAARAGKWPRQVPSCLKSAQCGGPAARHVSAVHGHIYLALALRRAQHAHGAAPRKSGSPAGTRRLRGLCLGAGRRRPLPRPCAPPTHSLNSLCPRASL
jgi:hypothetical protein